MPIDYLADRPKAVCDTECYPNLWMIGFRDLQTKKHVKLTLRPHGPALDRQRIAKILRNFRILTFNGINYDLPMIALAMTGATCAELKSANDLIIESGVKWWEFYERFECSVPDFVDHIDMMEVAPSAAQRFSLKKYAGCLHSKKMQELPIDPDTVLSEDEAWEIDHYLDNDLEVSDDLATEIESRIKIRAVISNRIGVDVRSKSDAQVGEAMIRQYVEDRNGGKRLYKPDIVPGAFNYVAPRYIEFQTPYMQAVLDRILRAKFVVKRDGYVELPEIFGKRKKKELDEDEEELEGGSEIMLGGAVYKMGIGGLHSQEKKVSYFEDDEYLLVDNDVTSYYPILILRSGVEPDNMRGHFRIGYQSIVDARIADKKAGRKDEAEGGKIAVNGLFGKTGSPYSVVYSPKMMIQTTVTGQLSILMLIEECVLRGWQVISANTDGFVTRVPRNEYGLLRAVIFDWECATGLQTEETFYRSVHSINVNSYVAFKKLQNKDGSFTGQVEAKRKSGFAPSGRGVPASYGLKKTPDVEICFDAVVDYLKDGTSIEQTIRNCQDIRKFVRVRKVAGGAEKDGMYIGKVVRFYYSVHSPGPLTYLSSGNNVPKSEGAEPCMELPDELPDDIDYEFYEREAYAILDDCGMEAIDPTTRGKSGIAYARLPEQKTVHRLARSKGIAICGASRKSRRDLWIEQAGLQDGDRLCSKCRAAEEL